MNLRLVTAILSLSFALTGCAGVQVGQHVAAQDYAGSPRRIFVVNRLDSSFQDTLPDDFAAAIVQGLSRCDVAAQIYRPSSIELDAEAKLRTVLESFRPDSVLNVIQTRRFLMDGDVRSGNYLLTLYDVGQKRSVWRASIGTGASARFLADRRVVGASFADEVVRTMAADNVVKTCPRFPSKQGG